MKETHIQLLVDPADQVFKVSHFIFTLLLYTTSFIKWIRMTFNYETKKIFLITLHSQPSVQIKDLPVTINNSLYLSIPLPETLCHWVSHGQFLLVIQIAPQRMSLPQ